ncbi:hypothetical protein [Amycolatopsis sp. RTGN1]|uniref:hypothetical protein n=1 Tax=Amycolatopsis ponsaeliensis TaxID=2992142 RepID=UPI00254B43C8|nr:hypothetical protein [Amycolatopsis sp. RTGN1]
MSRPRVAPTLPQIGTLVTAIFEDHTVQGKVMHYEHHSLAQSTFPVAFGPRWRTMTTDSITELPNQPPGRRPPPLTGECRRAAKNSADDGADPAIVAPAARLTAA